MPILETETAPDTAAGTAEAEFVRTGRILNLVSLSYLLVYFLEIGITAEIPKILLVAKDRETWLLAISALATFYSVRLCIEWGSMNTHRRSVSTFDFVFTLVFGLIPLMMTVYSYTIHSWVWTPVSLIAIPILAVGEFIAITVVTALDTLWLIRSAEEARRRGLHRLPVVTRSVVKMTVVVCIPLFLAAYAASYFWAPSQIREIFFYLVLAPMLLHMVLYAVELYKRDPEYLIAQKENVDWHDSQYQVSGWDKLAVANQTELYRASLRGDTDEVRRLLNKGADPNEVVERDWTPLMIAVAERNYSCVDVLIEYGADVNQPNALYRAPLNFASRYGDVELTRKLIGAGADVNYQGKVKETTALMNAAIIGSQDLVELLLLHDADIELTDYQGISAIAYAEKNEHGEIAKILRRAQKAAPPTD